MTIFLLSLGGVPPTGGFFAKFYLFRAAMESRQLYWLVIVGVLNSVGQRLLLPAIVVAMYFREPCARWRRSIRRVDECRPDHHRGRRRAAGRLPEPSSTGPAQSR